DLGASVIEIPVPGARHEFAVYTVIVTYEASVQYERVLRAGSQLLRPSLHNRFATGALFTNEEYVLARRGPAVVIDEMRRAMRDLDLLCLPTAPHVAPTWEKEGASPDWAQPSFRRLFNLTGQPAISVPAGVSQENLPVGLQLVGRWFEDSTVA